MAMVITLVKLPDNPFAKLGIYPEPNGTNLPERFRLLAPEAAKSLIDFGDVKKLVFSDVFRSAESSMSAFLSGRKAQPPSYSAHNYGLAFDLDVDRILKSAKWTYKELCARLAIIGWHCHRRDGARGSEDWHFNYLGSNATKYLDQAIPTHPGTWASAVESAIRARYSTSWALTKQELDLYFAKNKTTQKEFVAKWKLPTGNLFRLCRLVAYLDAKIVLI